MAFEREEMAATVARTAPEEITRLRMHQQAAVKMDLLTGDPTWDQYLSYVQAALDNTKKNRDGLMARLSSPQLVNNDQVAQIRVAILCADSQIATLEWSMAMPSQIKKLGEVSKQYLDKISRDENSEAA
jgi:hypothetical protein